MAVDQNFKALVSDISDPRVVSVLNTASLPYFYSYVRYQFCNHGCEMRHWPISQHTQDRANLKAIHESFDVADVGGLTSPGGL